MTTRFHSISKRIALALSLAAVNIAHADSNLLPRNMPDVYPRECAACHAAYPPAMLPARSWQRVIAGLDKHYGIDASLDAASREQIGAWLQLHAGNYKRAAEEPPQDRITQSAWFKRKHHDIDAAVWQHASVKSAANCSACHSGAERGDYDHDGVRLPTEADARKHRIWSR